MFVSFARSQYRRMLFSRIPKQRHFRTASTTGTYIPRDGCMIHPDWWQWQLGKGNFDNDCSDGDATLYVKLDEEEVRVDMSLDFNSPFSYGDHQDIRYSDGDFLQPLRLGVKLDDKNADKRLSEFFDRVRSLKMIDGKEYFDIKKLLCEPKVDYPYELSKSAHTQFISSELEIQKLIQNWDLRQMALEIVARYPEYELSDDDYDDDYDPMLDYGYGDSKHGDSSARANRIGIMKRFGIDEKELDRYYAERKNEKILLTLSNSKGKSV